MAKAIEYSKEYSSIPSEKAKVGHIHGKVRASADKILAADNVGGEDIEFAKVPKGAIIIGGGCQGAGAADDLSDLEIDGGVALAKGDVLSEEKLIVVKGAVNGGGDYTMQISYILE